MYARVSNIDHFLGRSSLCQQARPVDRSGAAAAALTEALRQLSAQLHVLGGMSLDAASTAAEETCPHMSAASGMTTRSAAARDELPLRHLHPYARSRVYDLRRYTAANMWGPFMDDGSARVDWEKVQAIMIDLAYNHRMYTARRGLGDGLLIGTPLSFGDNQQFGGSSDSASSASSAA